MHPRTAPALAAILTLLVLSAAPAAADLERPVYSPGDRWVYTLEGIAPPVPGMGTEMTMDLAGRVEVEVAGFETADMNGTSVRAARVLTRTSAFINGSFEMPPLPPATITGSIFANASELWEDTGYQTIESVATSSMVLDITSVVSMRMEMDTRTFANTTVTQADPFPLTVGETTNASLFTDLLMNITFSFFGNTTTTEGRTLYDIGWEREVLALETVSVEAGTFSAYRLNQSGTPTSGLPVGGFSGEYEIAHFSNEVGFYLKRVAYTNNTPTSEMRLRSYTYAARAPPFNWIPILLIVVAVAVGAILGVVWWSRRRRRAAPPPPPPLSVGPSGPGDGRAR